MTLKWGLAVIFALVLIQGASCQTSIGTPPSLIYVSVDPAGSCGNGVVQYNSTNGKTWGCQGGTWTQTSGGGGAPSGPAGGVLSGTYPNPSAQLNSPLANTQASTDKTTAVATDAFVQGLFGSLNQAVSVQAATVAVLPNTPTYSNGAAGVGATLTAGSNGALTIDGYTVLLNDRVLVNNQASAFQNGVYTQTTLGTGGVPYVLTRATDFNTVAEINTSGAIPVLNGTVNNNTLWVLNTAIAAIGTPNSINYSLGAATPFPTLTVTNASSTGTTLFKLVKLTGAPSTGVITATTDTSGAVGVCASGCGTTGTAQIVESGFFGCVFDGATTAGDYVQISSTTGGDCHDAGSSLPTSGEILGRVFTTNGSGGTFTVLWFSPDIAFKPSTNGACTATKYTITQSPFGTTWTVTGQSGQAVTASTTTQTINIVTLASKVAIQWMRLKYTTAWAGTSMTAFTMSVGTNAAGGSTTSYVPAFNVFAAVSDTPFGATPGYIDEGGLRSGADNGETVTLTAISTGGNLTATTAGSTDLTLCTVTLP